MIHCTPNYKGPTSTLTTSVMIRILQVGMGTSEKEFVTECKIILSCLHISAALYFKMTILIPYEVPHCFQFIILWRKNQIISQRENKAKAGRLIM